MTAEVAIRALDFSASIDRDADGITLRIEGSADSAVAMSLEPLVARLHGELVGAGARAVAVDLRTLEFMSASCFTVFVEWLNLVNELEPARRYRLVFASSSAIPWQRRSLKTLSCFAVDLVTVEAT